MAYSLCNSSTNFTFTDTMQTSVALTNMYLYLSIFNPQYYDEFMQVSGLSSTEEFDFFYKDDNSLF